MTDWLAVMAGWAYAHGQPQATATLKAQPDDFHVIENMPFQPSGSGEHTWLNLRKTKLNTEQVSKQLARCAGVANKAVGYSGRKDVQAVTDQWFSVWLPGQVDPDWLTLRTDQLELLKVARHNKKLKLGTHDSNSFVIRLRNFCGSQTELLHRKKLITEQGVPNYFGAQRFGRHASNMQRAHDMFKQNRRIKDRSERGMLLSSARAWLFNECVSARVVNATWASLIHGEPCILAGSESYFHAQGSSEENPDLKQRLESGDIHPSAPMQGRWRDELVARFPELHHTEQQVCAPYANLVNGLNAAGLDYARRATRCLPQDFELQLQGDEVLLSFTLPRGQFATSVLRELVQT